MSCGLMGARNAARRALIGRAPPCLGSGPHVTEPGELLQKSQYKAHVTAERALGLMPPLVAFEAHRYFVEVLGYCRDTLGALAAAESYDEPFGDEAIDAGLQALRTSREAFQAAQYASYAVYNRPDGFYPASADAAHDPVVPRWLSGATIIAGLTVLAASMFVLLLLGPGQ